MASDTSSRPREARGPLTLDELAGRLSGDGVLLAFRIADFERAAWREGRKFARGLEKRAIEAFRTIAAQVLRRGDAVAHDAGSDVFLAALVCPPREPDTELSPDVLREISARVERVFRAATDFDVESGWTTIVAEPFDVRSAAAAALERGARMRERYAFFSLVGHELRTPLGTIRGYLEAVLDGTVRGTEARRYTTLAVSETQRMRRLINAMFELSLVDLGGDAGRRSRSCGLPQAVAVAVDALGPAASGRGATIGIGEVAGAMVPLPSEQAEQLVMNLIENAIRHGRAGGRVLISAVAVRRFVELHVDDDGPGVAPADRERIFALAVRASGAETHGSGLGLALVRLFAERAGGEVCVSESPLGGARFTVRLPFQSTVL